jgi:hypothetical protein
MTAGGGGELLWRPPGETEWAIVPPDAFVPVVWP